MHSTRNAVNAGLSDEALAKSEIAPGPESRIRTEGASASLREALRARSQRTQRITNYATSSTAGRASTIVTHKIVNLLGM